MGELGERCGDPLRRDGVDCEFAVAAAKIDVIEAATGRRPAPSPVLS